MRKREERERRNKGSVRESRLNKKSFFAHRSFLLKWVKEKEERRTRVEGNKVSDGMKVKKRARERKGQSERERERERERGRCGKGFICLRGAASESESESERERVRVSVC
jgi:hypothetical protein